MSSIIWVKCRAHELELRRIASRSAWQQGTVCPNCHGEVGAATHIQSLTWASLVSPLVSLGL
jgi:hypothetical protein